LVWTIRGCAPRPLRFTIRPNTSPVTADPSGFFATGTLSQCLPPTDMVERIAVPFETLMPALSPCQALANPTSPKLRSATTIVIGVPRLGTSCHIMPLA
jgi:hypothetical protein